MAWWWPFGKKEERKEQKRIYQGAIYNRLTSDWLASSTSADSEIVSSLRTLRNRVRSLCRDNDYAKGAVRTICNNIVGKGIPLQAKVKQKRGEKYDERINKEIEALWEDWGSAEFCDCAGKLDFSDIERLAMRSLIESGEVLIRLVRKSFDDSPVPLALELIESDQLADDQWSGTAENGNEIRMGVEIDKWGRPVAYHLYEKHPGDFQFTSSVGQRLIRVPASEIIHLFICDRPGQTRGVPWFHSALTTFRHVGGYTEAELVAARAQAAVMGFITTPDTDVYAPEEMAGQRVTSLEPGAIEVLNPGESFEGFAPTRPGQGFDAFIRMMLRGVAAGIGLSYEALSRDFSNTSYSSARTSLMDERDNYRVIQSWLIRRLHKRIYKKWLDLAVLSGSLKIGDYELNRRFYQKAKFTPRGWQWVDPQNEVAANKDGVKAGFVSITDVVAQQGLDVEDVLQEQKRILDLAKDLGLSLDVLAEGGGQEPPPTAEGMTPIRIMPEPTRTFNSQQEAKAQQESEDFILGDYTVTSLLEYRSLQQMGVDIFFDILPGLTRTFSSRKRARNCKKGIACGDTCIAKNRVCKQNLPPAVAAQVPPAKAKTKKAAGGATTAPAAPSAPAPAPAPAPAAPATPQTTVSKGADPYSQLALMDYQKQAKALQKKAIPGSDEESMLKASEASWSAIGRANKAGKDVVFLKDKNGEILAAASLKEKTEAGITATYVDYIAVSPIYLPISANTNRRVLGAGRELLDQIITDAHSQGKKVAVTGFSSSNLTDYFEKAGFSDSGKVDKKYQSPIFVTDPQKPITLKPATFAAPQPASASAPQPAAASAAAAASPQKTTTKKPKASPAPAQSNAVSSATVTTNQAELDKKRNNLAKRFGKQLVEKAETNVKQILDDPDNDIYIRVGSADTLEKILGNRFLTSAELNITQHKIPFLSDDYQTARNRVEQKVLGVDLNTDPANRPIYGYMGSSDLNGNSHNSGVQDYGSIVVKLKPETKTRTTFTGSDSFKSGIASELVGADNPPPPNAASLVATTRHGYDKDSLPSGYPAFYKSKAGEKDQLTKAANANNIDDLVNHLSPTGAKYIETQIHGGVSPSDIAELRFESNKAKPTPAIGQLAKANGIDLIVDGKKLSSKELDKLIGGNVTPAAKTGYKPKMTRAEADAYTKNSVYANKVFYHGTGDADAKSITTDGVDPLRTSTSFYGKGFYTSTDKKTAQSYSKGAIIAMKLDVKKPLVVYDQADLKRQMTAMGVKGVVIGGNQTDKVATQMREALLKNGYDAIKVQAYSYFIPLKQDSVAVFQVKADIWKP